MNGRPLQPLPLYALPPVFVPPPSTFVTTRATSVPVPNLGWGANYRRTSPTTSMNRQLTENAIKGLLKLKNSKTRRSSRKSKKNTRRR